jgi:isoquinoline 1-oxidoreductase beta subunit
MAKATPVDPTPTPTTLRKWTRRALLASGGLVGGGLALGVGWFTLAPNRLSVLPQGKDAGGHRVTTWILLAPDNTLTVVVPHCEMGQGAQTTLAMMAAEEMDADWNLVRVQEAPAAEEFANGYLVRVFVPGVASVPRFLERGLDFASFKLTQMLPVQTTGGSSSVRGTGHYGMRVAGATARAMLLSAAADQWRVPVGECTAQGSHVMHASSKRVLAFGELAQRAAKLEPPLHPPLKPSGQWRVMGTPTPRFDIPSKVDGSATYGLDVSLPGMLYAAVAGAPVFGTQLQQLSGEPAVGVNGVRRVVRLDAAVAVVAESYWRALQALRQIVPSFSDSPAKGTSSASIFAAMRAKLEGSKNDEVFAQGDALAAFSGAAKVVDAEYQVPFLAHATLEPMNATVHFNNGRCEVWSGVQDPLAARKVVARAADLKESAVTFHNLQLGGGFGRRLPGFFDYLEQAVRIAKQVNAPVKLIWSREEDTQHDFYRPAALARYRGAIDAKGRPTAWLARFTGGSGDGAALIPYRLANQDIRSVEVEHHIRTGAWRSVDHSQHAFFKESFIDELAHAAQADPYEYRRALLRDSPRHRAVLEKAAVMAGWGAPAAAGRARGIALAESFGSIVAQVAEVEIDAGRIKVRRVWAAVDCGHVVNPDAGRAQIEGGIIFGLSAALFSEITVRDGRIAQSSFTDYLLPKLADAPRISVDFIDSGAELGGLGEPGVPPIAPAIANAVFAATGVRLRSLPLRLPS